MVEKTDGQVAYEAFNHEFYRHEAKHTRLLAWEELSEDIRAKWNAIARAVNENP